MKLKFGKFARTFDHHLGQVLLRKIDVDPGDLAQDVPDDKLFGLEIIVWVVDGNGEGLMTTSAKLQGCLEADVDRILALDDPGKDTAVVRAIDHLTEMLESISTADGDDAGEAEADPSALRELVHDALDNAKANGYTAGKADGMKTVAEIADDLLTYNAPLEGCEPEQIMPHIESWLAKHATA